MKAAEEIIREEIRALREIILKLLQWGVTLLASMQAAFFFLRREYLTYQIDNGMLARGSYLPLKAYLGGTGFLFALAMICTIILTYTGKQYRGYQKLLKDHRESDIQDPSTSPRARSAMRVIVYGMYFFFPIIDLVFRFVYVGFK